MSKVLNLKSIPVILSVFLYILLYILRWQQGGWEIKSNLFEDQRQILNKKIETFLPSPQAELLSGMLLGQKKDLPGHLRLALRDTSTIHIVVVSGQNLTLLAGLIMSFSGLIKRKNSNFIGFQLGNRLFASFRCTNSSFKSSHNGGISLFSCAYRQEK